MRKPDGYPLVFEPIGSLVVVAPLRVGQLSSTIITPDSADSNHITMEAIVVAVGPERKQVELGDIVAHAPHDGRHAIVEGSVYRIMPEDKIFGVYFKMGPVIPRELMDDLRPLVFKPDEYEQARGEILDALGATRNRVYPWEDTPRLVDTIHH
jgi:co-chaperonin GroES (HSP10)